MTLNHLYTLYDLGQQFHSSLYVQLITSTVFELSYCRPKSHKIINFWNKKWIKNQCFYCLIDSPKSWLRPFLYPILEVFLVVKSKIWLHQNSQKDWITFSICFQNLKLNRSRSIFIFNYREFLYFNCFLFNIQQ